MFEEEFTIKSLNYTRGGGIMKCPEKYAKDTFFTWWYMYIFLKCQKFWQNNRTYENRAFKKNTWWEFEQKKRETESSRILGISKNMHIPSHEKYIFHMLFRAFYKLGCVVRMVVDSILRKAGQMTIGKTHPRLIPRYNSVGRTFPKMIKITYFESFSG